MKLYKKCPNRSLYDAELGCYCTLADIADAVRSGLDFEIRKNISKGVLGADVTREVLMQALVECESKREAPKLTIEKLRELIRE